MGDNFQNWLYSDEVKDHFVNPRNLLGDEDPEGFDGKGVVGNIKCGDQMMVVINVDPDKEVIKECRWKTYGCASAIASTSMLSEMVKGLTLEKARSLSAKEITEALGGLPEHKIHCSVLGDKGLREAVNDYFRKRGETGRIREEKGSVVCECMNVTDLEIENAMLEGARTYEQLQEHTKIGTVCGKCRDKTLKLMDEYERKHFS